VGLRAAPSSSVQASASLPLPPLPASPAGVPAFPAGDGRRRQEERVEPRQPQPCVLGCNEPAGTQTVRRATARGGSGAQSEPKSEPESAAGEPGAAESQTQCFPGGVRNSGLGARVLRGKGTQGGGGQALRCSPRWHWVQPAAPDRAQHAQRRHRGSAMSLFPYPEHAVTGCYLK
jgi:hypothetical protein